MKREEKEQFDIVIPVGPSDREFIHIQLEYTRKNVIGYRNIYIITYDDTMNINGCIMVSEKQFPFSLHTVIEYHGKNDRNGWYLQQLLKFYAGFIIPGILDRYLVIDADTCFLKPTTFINEEGKCLYNYGMEYHEPYFEHMQKLHPLLTKQLPISGICNYMIFEKEFVKELFDMVESNHYREPFYKIFLSFVSPTTVEKSGASEYEIYFNYMVSNHPEKIDIRYLSYSNANMDILNTPNDFDYISVHYYLR